MKERDQCLCGLQWGCHREPPDSLWPAFGLLTISFFISNIYKPLCFSRCSDCINRGLFVLEKTGTVSKYISGRISQLQILQKTDRKYYKYSTERITNTGSKILRISDRRYYEIRTEDITNTGPKKLQVLD